MLGFFSTSAINVLANGFATFLYNGGKMRLIINDILSEEDKAAIQKGTATDDLPYFDEIEDDIINMRRDINGFKMHISPPRYLDKPIPGGCPVNFKGWTFEVKNQPVDLGEHVEWDDI